MGEGQRTSNNIPWSLTPYFHHNDLHTSGPYILAKTPYAIPHTQWPPLISYSIFRPLLLSHIRPCHVPNDLLPAFVNIPRSLTSSSTSAQMIPTSGPHILAKTTYAILAHFPKPICHSGSFSSEPQWHFYIYCQWLTGVLSTIIRNYYTLKLRENEGNGKKTWEILNSILGKNKQQLPYFYQLWR